MDSRWRSRQSLKRGDRVTVKHDNYIAEVVAQRTLGGGGIVQQILVAITYRGGR